MLNIKTRTEYSFRIAYGQIDKVLSCPNVVGISDRNGTWGHVEFSRQMKKLGKRPVFGVELGVVQDAAEKSKQPMNFMAFFAKNNGGLQEIYELTTLATSQKYYYPRIDYSQLMDLSENVFIFSGIHPQLGLLSRKKNVFMELSPMTSERNFKFAQEKGMKLIAASDNFFPRIGDRGIYEIVAANNKESSTAPMHILTEREWKNELPFWTQDAITNGEDLYAQCEAVLPTAKMVHPDVNQTLEEMCREGAIKRKIDLTSDIYGARLRREIDLIKEKQFEDYFYVIADLIQYAKQHMLVGPARGSSCGSLVCYLLGITDIDPIRFDLLFERFIDVTRGGWRFDKKVVRYLNEIS